MRDRYVIIMAAGSGSRMGAEQPKQFLELEGKAILHKTMEAFLEAVPDVKINCMFEPIQMNSDALHLPFTSSKESFSCIPSIPKCEIRGIRVTSWPKHKSAATVLSSCKAASIIPSISFKRGAATSDA